VTPQLTATQAGGKGSMYAVLLRIDARFNTLGEPENYNGPPAITFPGVRLGGFTERLRLASSDEAETWPTELKVLRHQITTGAQSLEASLHGANHSPDVVGPAERRDPGLSSVRVDEHIAQFAMHHNNIDGHEQWFLFDDVWAASHPELAESLLRYA